MHLLRDVEPVVGGWLEERMVCCRRKGCRCANGRLHGPYVYLNFRVYDERVQGWRLKRQYVRQADVVAVRRLLCLTKAADRAAMSMIRGQGEVLETLELLRHRCRGRPLRRLSRALSFLESMLKKRRPHEALPISTASPAAPAAG